MDGRRYDPYVSGVRDDSAHTATRRTETADCPWCAALWAADLPATPPGPGAAKAPWWRAWPPRRRRDGTTGGSEPDGSGRPR